VIRSVSNRAGYAIKVSIIVLSVMFATPGVAVDNPNVVEKSFDVDVLRPFDASRKDDMRLMRGYFQSASWEYSIPEMTWDRLKLIGLRGIRLINVESNRAVRSVRIDGALSFDFSLLLPALADCRRYGLIPHIVVGQRMQDLLAIRDKASAYGIADLRAYEDYAFALMKFVARDQGFSNADFEVGNEPDTNGAAWLLDGAHKNGAPEMYEAYLALYEAWAKAADRLTRAFPEARIRLGGPALTPYTLYYGEVEWARQFVSAVARRQLRLDFFSVHLYGDQQSLRGATPNGPYPSLADGLAYYKRLLKESGLAHVPLYVTEWGPCADTDDSPCGAINGDEVGAAWAAKFVIEMAESGVDEGIALILRDHMTADGKRDNLSWPAFLLADGQTPKALYNVARIFRRMADQRMVVSGGDDVTTVLASSSGSRVTIMAVNQQWNFSRSADEATRTRLSVTVHPWHSGSNRVNFVRYVIDRSHSNVYRSRQTGARRIKAELQSVEQGTVDVVNGALHLPSVIAEPSSITYWEITGYQPP
jgi:xylan 1,4-beta-xylosidase